MHKIAKAKDESLRATKKAKKAAKESTLAEESAPTEKTGFDAIRAETIAANQRALLSFGLPVTVAASKPVTKKPRLARVPPVAIRRSTRNTNATADEAANGSTIDGQHTIDDA